MGSDTRGCFPTRGCSSTATMLIAAWSVPSRRADENAIQDGLRSSIRRDACRDHTQ